MYLIVVVSALVANARGFALPVVYFTMFFVVLFSPAIILHYTYYLQAKDMQIEFIEGGLKVSEGNKWKTIKDEEILTIELYMTPSLVQTGNPTGRYPWEEYYYAKIVSESGDTIINNLLYPDLLNIDRYLNLSKFKYISRIFPFLP